MESALLIDKSSMVFAFVRETCRISATNVDVRVVSMRASRDNARLVTSYVLSAKGDQEIAPPSM